MSLSAGRVIALFAVAGLMVSACGSSGSSSTPSPSPTPTPTPKPTVIGSVDACTLVTAAEASAAAGTTVANIAGAGGVSVPGACIYATSDGKTFVLVVEQAYPNATAASAVSPEQMAAVLSAYGTIANAKVVTGIGDKAIEYNLTPSSGGAGIMIFVFKANVVLMIAISPSSSPSTVESLAASATAKIH